MASESIKGKTFILGPNGMEELVSVKDKIKIGLRIFGEFGIAFSESGTFAVSKLNENNFEMVEIGGDHRKCIEDYNIRPISKKFGIGAYYDDVEYFIFSEDDIKKALADYEVAEAERQQQKKDEQKAREKERQDLIASYNDLIRVDLISDYREVKKAAKKNLLTLLKKNFPNQKFSCRVEHGSALYVEWTDGPIEDDVSAIVHKFQDSHSDYTGDYWDYDPSIFNDLFGGYSYTFTRREFSEETVKRFREEYNKNMNWADGTDESVIEQFFWREIRKTDFSVKVKTAEPVSASDIEIVDYSDKAIAIIGNTKPIKDKLKELGCRFNAYLKCGAGWIAPKSKLETVKLALGV